ncbi:GNAT family N-acetyltransferase [Vibrio sp.]|nr:GNAT family N-acetyltransferase [Vibrio sp.]
MNRKIEIFVADYANSQHAKDLIELLNDYANDEMGGNEPISEYVRTNLVAKLREVPGAFSLLCYVDNQPAGLCNCFEAFSTFAAKPLVNIHDIAIKASFRGLGLSQRLLEEVESIARKRDCCKVTLEVLAGNSVAQSAYTKFGFTPYELSEGTGIAQFWQKKLK